MNGKAEANAAHRVVIVGAGFGGLSAAESLARSAAQITIIDRRNHHTFQPLLYQVATAGLSPGEITAPIRAILGRHKNVEVLMAEITEVDLERHVVQAADLEVPYDSLIVAAGASHAYFGHNEWEEFAPGLKNIEDALEIRRRILLAFELAERQASTGEHLEPLNFVVVGGGPTGVELAGTLAEICRHSLAGEFRAIDPARARIHLIEGGPNVLPTYPPDLSRSAREQLQRLGVEVLTSSMVSKVEAGAIYIGEKRMEAAVILWAAGVSASPLGKKLGFPTDRAGRVLVNSDLSIPNHPEVFVIGDLASLKDARGNPLPGVAPVAIQQGRFVAKIIRHELTRGMQRTPSANGREPSRPVFRYHDKGNLATIGRAAAVAEIGRFHISGYFAWLTWLFVHIFFLIGFRNRILVLIQWAASYLTFERGARLITGSTNLPGWHGLRREGSEAQASRQEISAAARK